MSGLNLLVFRSGQRCASGQELKAELTAQMEQLPGHGSQRTLLGALLLAGEFECGVADCDPEAARSCDVAHRSACRCAVGWQRTAASTLILKSPDFQFLLDAARALPTFEQLSISTPEGFAYYALHPLAYADVMRQIPACDRLLVVGIRSIGTTLSAVAAAAARARGISVERITVRPQGHPYNRTAEFTAGQMDAVREQFRAALASLWWMKGQD